MLNLYNVKFVDIKFMHVLIDYNHAAEPHPMGMCYLAMETPTQSTIPPPPPPPRSTHASFNGSVVAINQTHIIQKQQHSIIIDATHPLTARPSTNIILYPSAIEWNFQEHAIVKMLPMHSITFLYSHCQIDSRVGSMLCSKY